MYEHFYDLRERPFSLSPDPAYLFRSGVHREALSYLRYGIEGFAGFVVITGEVGSGKTTLLQTALRSLDQQTSVSRIVNTMLDARELIEAVMLDFGLEPESGWSKPRLLRELARFLVEQRNAGRLALLVIDEAQNLSLPALEEVRMLSNFETERSKLMQIVMVGQPGLRDTLLRPELEQMRQRITVSYHLNPLTREETAGYINHRLRRAANGAPLEFPSDAADLVHRHSGGVPRMINVIADAVLLYGYGDDERQITAPLAGKAIDDLITNGVLTAPRSGPRPAAAPQAPAPVSDVDLLTRERRIAERERQLMEQQYVLDDEFRRLAAMLRTDDTRAPARPPADTYVGAAAPARSQAPAPAAVSMAAPSSASTLPSNRPAVQAAVSPPREVAPFQAVPQREPTRRETPFTPPAMKRVVNRETGSPLYQRQPLADFGSASRIIAYQQDPGPQPASFWSWLRRGLFGEPGASADE